MNAVVTALASGNCVVAIVDEQYLEETQAISHAFKLAGLPAGVFQVLKLGQIENLLNHPALAGAITHCESPLSQYVAETISARTGAILPMISTHANEALFHRLVTEKTITIDTTAAGGNASLMTMESNAG